MNCTGCTELVATKFPTCSNRASLCFNTNSIKECSVVVNIPDFKSVVRGANPLIPGLKDLWCKGNTVSCQDIVEGSIPSWFVYMSYLNYSFLWLLPSRFKYYYMLSVGLLTFLIGLIGLLVNTKSLIHLILSLELLMLGASIVALFAAFQLYDLDGELIALYVITIAGAESAIALAMVTTIYRLRGSIDSIL